MVARVAEGIEDLGEGHAGVAVWSSAKGVRGEGQNTRQQCMRLTEHFVGQDEGPERVVDQIGVVGDTWLVAPAEPA